MNDEKINFIKGEMSLLEKKRKQLIENSMQDFVLNPKIEEINQCIAELRDKCEHKDLNNNFLLDSECKCQICGKILKKEEV